MNKVLLSCEPFFEKHDHVNMLNKINGIVNEFSLDKEKLKVTTDCEGALVLGLLNGNYNHTKCLAHGIHNLIDTDGLNAVPEIKSLIIKLKKIINFLKFKQPLLTEIYNNLLLCQNDLQLEEFDLNLLIQLTDNFFDFLRRDEIVSQNESDLSYNLETEEMEIDESISNNQRANSNQTNNDESVDNQSVAQENQLNRIHEPVDDLRDRLLIESFPASLKNCIVSRWWTKLPMLTSFKQNFNLIDLALRKLNKYDLCVTSIEKDTINELIDQLTKINRIGQSMCADKYSVASRSVFNYFDLKVFFNQSNDAHCRIEPVKRFRNKIRNNLDRRYELTNDHYAAFFLDPMFKNSHIIDEKVPNRLLFLNNQINQLNQMNQSNNRQSSDSQSNATQLNNSQLNNNTNLNNTNRNSSSRLNELNDLEQRMGIEISVETEASSSEVARYLESPISADKPEEYWPKNEAIFPNLYKLFLKNGALQPTECSCERLFNQMAHIATDTRANLGNYKLKQIIFIKQNYEILKALVNKYNCERLDNQFRLEEDE